MASPFNVHRLPPLQYDFSAKWMSEVRKLLDRPPLIQAFASLRDKYVGQMADMFEEGHLGEGQKAYLLFQSKVLEAEACCQDLYWIKDHIEPFDAADLSLAIARELHPLEDWKIVETDGIHSVVSNSARSIVFDLTLFDELSAVESLLYAGDDPSKSRAVPDDRLAPYLQRLLAASQAAIEKLRSHLSEDHCDA